MRRKIGGWVNLTAFLPLITSKADELSELEEELDNLPSYHKRSQKTLPDRYYGVWSQLDIARRFAKAHDIYDILEPILAFDRVALVNYMGFRYFEYFVCPTVDIAIRILRDTSSKHIERINMDQLFIALKKLRGDGNLQLQRSFYTYYKNIFRRGESTSLGGHWTDRVAVTKFAKKHGILDILKPILLFPLNDPSKQDAYPIDIVWANTLLYWKSTSCDDSFYGFPPTFKGGMAPKIPTKERRNRIFRYADLTVEKRFSIETIKGGETYRNNFSLLRRLSDGAVNASILISICVLLKSNELNLGKEDPDFLIHNELYQRDKLENVPCETVTVHSSKYLNGKWCSVKDARFLFGQFNLVKSEKEKDKEGREVESLRQFLYDERFKHVESFDGKDNEEILEEGDGDRIALKQEDEEFVLIPENDFKKIQNGAKKEPIYYDSKFFSDEESSEEEALDIADFNEYEHADKGVDSPDDDDSNYVEEEERISASRLAKRRRIVKDSSDGEETSSGKKRKTRFFVPSDDDEDEDGDDEEEEDDEDDDEGYEGDEGDESENDHDDESEYQVEEENQKPSSTNSQKDLKSQPDIDERLDNLKRQEQAEIVVLSLKALVANFETIWKKNQRSTRVQKEFDGYFQDLQKYRAVTTELKIRANLMQTLKHIKNFANNYNRKVEELERNWKDQELDGELPSKDQVVRALIYTQNHDKLDTNKSSGHNVNHPTQSAYSRVHRTKPPSPIQPKPQPKPWGSVPVGPQATQYAPYNKSFKIFNNPNGHYSGLSPPIPPTQPNQPAPHTGQYNSPSLPSNTRFYPGGSISGMNNRQYPPVRAPQPVQKPIPGQGPITRASPTIHQAQINTPKVFNGQQPIKGVEVTNGRSFTRMNSSNTSQPVLPQAVTATQSQVSQGSQMTQGVSPSSSPAFGSRRPGSSGNLSSKYRERVSEGRDSYIPSQTYVKPNLTTSSTSSSAIPTSASRNVGISNGERLTDRVDEPLSPPSNYMEIISGEDTDNEDMSIEKYDDMIKEKDERQVEKEKMNDPLDKYRRVVHFETRTKQDLFKRARVIFQEDKRVGFSERLHAMMLEGYERRHGIKLNIKKGV